MPQIDIKLTSTANTAGFTQTQNAAASLNGSLRQIGTGMGEIRNTATRAIDPIGESLARLNRRASLPGLTSSISRGLFGLRAMEWAANKVARALINMSEQEEAAYKINEALSDEAAKLAIKNMESRLSNEQHLRLAIMDRDRLIRSIDSSHAKTAVEQEEVLKKRIRLEERIAEIKELQKKKGDEEVDATTALAKAVSDLQTVRDDPTRSDFTKRRQEISLMETEFEVRKKLIDLIKSEPAKDGETQRSRDDKARTLQVENDRLNNLLREKKFDSPDQKKNRESNEGFDQFREEKSRDIGSGGHAGLDIGRSAISGGKNFLVSLGTQAEQVSKSIERVLGGAVTSISDGLMGWIEHTKTFRQALASIGGSILKSLINQVVEMGVKMLLNGTIFKAVMIGTEALGNTLRSARVVKENAAEAATLPAKTAGATAAGISSFGVAIAFGLIAIALIASLAGGFADGGFTSPGDKNKPAGIVHAGEWVAPQWMVKHSGFGQIIAGLEGARQGSPGFDMGGFTSPAGSITQPGYTQPEANSRPVVNILMDPAQFARLQQEHSEHWFQEMSAQHMRKKA